jgi:hypothetical protein
MFDIIPPHQHKLALPINIESIHHAQTRLTGPPTCRTHPPGEEGAHDQQQNQEKNDDHDRAEHIGRGNAEFVEQGLHRGFHPAHRPGRP